VELLSTYLFDIYYVYAKLHHDVIMPWYILR